MEWNPGGQHFICYRELGHLRLAGMVEDTEQEHPLRSSQNHEVRQYPFRWLSGEKDLGAGACPRPLGDDPHLDGAGVHRDVSFSGISEGVAGPEEEALVKFPVGKRGGAARLSFIPIPLVCGVPVEVTEKRWRQFAVGEDPGGKASSRRRPVHVEGAGDRASVQR